MFPIEIHMQSVTTSLQLRTLQSTRRLNTKQWDTNLNTKKFGCTLFRREFHITNSYLWLLKTLLWIIHLKNLQMINTHFIMKNNKKVPKKFIKIKLGNLYSELATYSTLKKYTRNFRDSEKIELIRNIQWNTLSATVRGCFYEGRDGIMNRII